MLPRPARPAPRRARRLARRTTALAAALLLSVSLAACGDDDALGAGDVETVLDPPSEPAATVSVVVPVGTVDVGIDEPAEEVGELSAPGGGSLLRISTDFRDAEVRRDVWAFAARAGEAKPVELAVRVGEESYPLGVVRLGASAEDQASTTLQPVVVVAVDGEPGDLDLDEVALEVTYDGLTQTVGTDGERQPGPADALYEEVPEPGDLPEATCDGDFDDDEVDVRGFECRVGAVRALPYLPDLGWAEDGRTWTVLTVGTTLPTVTTRPSGATAAGSYTAAELTPTTRLDGSEQVGAYDVSPLDAGAGYRAQLAFDTAAGPGGGTLDILLDYELSLRDSVGDGAAPPAVRRLGYRAVVDLADLAARG